MKTTLTEQLQRLTDANLLALFQAMTEHKLEDSILAAFFAEFYRRGFSPAQLLEDK
jgi:ribose 5-phosphate isomerase RpiB